MKISSHNNYTSISATDTNITSTAIPPLQPQQLPLSLTIEQVGAELRRLRSGKVVGPEGVCQRLLKDFSRTDSSSSSEALQYEPSDGKSPKCCGRLPVSYRSPN